MKRHVAYRPATFRAATVLAHALPAPFLRWLARRLADLNYFLVPRFRHVIRGNLSHVIKDQHQLARASRRLFCNFAESLTDYVIYEQLTREQLDHVLTQNAGIEHLDAALAQKRGVIVVTVHLGNWELGGTIFALMGYPMTAVTLEEHIDALTDMRENYRVKHGIRTVRVGKTPFAAIDLVKVLQEGGLVAMLIDRPTVDAELAVNFLGARYRFSSAPALLAHLTGAAVLPAYVIGVGGGRYRASIEPPVPMEEGERNDAILKNTQRLATRFESIIAKHPDQWYQFVPTWEAE